MPSPDNDPARALAQRLRQLRKRHWPDVAITQSQLAKAIGGGKPASAPLISSWENLDSPVTPPAERLVRYATFFATRRSVEARPYRVFSTDELTPDERKSREQLKQELLAMRDAASQAGGVASATPSLGGLWQFSDGHPVTIVSAEVPPDQLHGLARPEDPKLAYGEFYTYADIDSLFELYGHVRAANPQTHVVVRKPSKLEPDDYTTHLVVLGGAGRTTSWLRMFAPLNSVPVRQVCVGEGPQDYYFQVGDGDEAKQYRPLFTQDGQLAMDVGHHFRGPNPFNRRRTLTVCYGMFSLGTLGVVRALTDERFRDRNAGYVALRFQSVDAYSILMKVPIVAHEALTPDWTLADTRLHEWPSS